MQKDAQCKHLFEHQQSTFAPLTRNIVCIAITVVYLVPMTHIFYNRKKA